MQYFTVEANTPKEALAKMRRQYGEEALILNHKSVRKGGILGLFSRESVEITGYLPARASPRTTAGLEEEKRRIMESARREQGLQQVLKEIQSLRESVQKSAVLSAPHSEGPALPPALAGMEEILRANDFSEDLLREILQRVRLEFSLEDLEKETLLHHRVLEWIGEKIRIHPPLEAQGPGTRAFALVGPTGVGKTTTIAKLAAIYGLGTPRIPARPVKIVTIDNYRIAARSQIETYAEIMRIPVYLAESAADMKKVLALAGEGDLILVDTIGKSPRDLARLAEMKGILEAGGRLMEAHLAVSATTKASDLEEVLRNFEPFGYRSLVLTKLDETMRVGNLVSVLARTGKPVSYLADGQGVPQDIEEASVLRLLMNLDGFRVNREKMEERFGKRAKILES